MSAWVALALLLAAYGAAGASIPRHLAWLAAGLVFIPFVVVGAFGLELEGNDEGAPLELLALLAAPAFAIAYGVGYALRGR